MISLTELMNQKPLVKPSSVFFFFLLILCVWLSYMAMRFYSNPAELQRYIPLLAMKKTGLAVKPPQALTDGVEVTPEGMIRVQEPQASSDSARMPVISPQTDNSLIVKRSAEIKSTAKDVTQSPSTVKIQGKNAKVAVLRENPVEFTPEQSKEMETASAMREEHEKELQEKIHSAKMRKIRNILIIVAALAVSAVFLFRMAAVEK